MKMSFIEQLIYPKFNRYLRDSLPAVAEVGAIKRAFQRYGQLDHAALKRALKWGEEPTVNVADLVDAYGEFTPTPGSNWPKRSRVATPIAKSAAPPST